jgi:hypothetical protein
MTPRFKGKPNFDLPVSCPSCGYKIQPNELLPLTSHMVKRPRCSGVFDDTAGKRPLNTS